jgi:hypothetical protein
MNQTEPKFIGKRILVKRAKDSITIEINQKIQRWQEAMLFFWITAWTFCGGAFLYYAFNAANQSEQIFFIICSSLWLFFFIRITKVFLWRLIGKEIIRMDRETFNYQTIFKLGLIKRDPASFLAFLDDSFWIIGGERIGFSYSGRKIQLGKQLDARDAELLLRMMESAIREYKKG